MLVFMVIMIVGAITLLVSSLVRSTADVQMARDKVTTSALNQAKQALIAYAVTYADTHSNTVPGYLPCPDINAGNGEGSSQTCGNKNVSSIGRLPWKTLNLEPLRDSYGECLWYAVSGTYKNNPTTDMMNWDTSGLFQVSDANGNTASDVVAVVFAPGPVLSGQDRTPSGTAPLCGGNYTPSNYLDSDGTHNNASVSATANATSNFYSGTSSQINDRMVYITRQDIWNAISNRNDFKDQTANPATTKNPLLLMTYKATLCIADYGKRNYYYSSNDDLRLPWAGRLINPTTDYWTDSNYDDDGNTPLIAGRLPFRVNNSDSATYNNLFSPYYQLASNGSGCPDVTDWSTYYPWWSNWKTHLFYAVAYDFSPHGVYPDTACSGHCLAVNSTGTYAAIVIFAGKPLAGQSRTADSDKLNPANYLESNNLSNITHNSSFSPYNNYTNGAATSTFNDVLYCVDQLLNVAPCP